MSIDFYVGDLSTFGRAFSKQVERVGLLLTILVSTSKEQEARGKKQGGKKQGARSKGKGRRRKGKGLEIERASFLLAILVSSGDSPLFSHYRQMFFSTSNTCQD